MLLMGNEKDDKIGEMVIKDTQMGIGELEKELEECHDKSKQEVELITTIVKAYKKNITAIRKLA